MNKSGCSLISAYAVIVITFIAMMVGCFGCNSVKQANKHYDIAKRKNIVQVATRARTDWPCTSLKADTVKGPDSIVYKDRVVSQYVNVHDTTIVDGKPVIKTRLHFVDCNCRDSIVYQPRYITNTVEDSAKVMVANAERNAALKDADKYKGRANTKGWIIAAIAALFVIYLLLTKTFKIL